jgi:ribosomal-protein-alanine N-acetyltransferase
MVELDRLCLGGIWTVEGYQRELESPNSTLLALSVPSDHIIGCGCFWAILEEAHITLIVIDPNYQGRGLGQLLLHALLQDAIARQLERATLEVRASNQVALSLYRKFGFQIAGRRKGYYRHTGEDALILWRNDLQQPEFREQLRQWEGEIGDRLLREQFQPISLAILV